MTKQEFERLSEIENVDEMTYRIIDDAYMQSRSNKYDFVLNFMYEFKRWIWRNLENLLTTKKNELLDWFVRDNFDLVKLFL